MGQDTKIQWAHHTFNPWRGCTKVAAGCTNCYADAQSKRNPGTLGIWGDNGTRVVTAEKNWQEVLKWSRLAEDDPEVRSRVFVASMADVFENWTGKLHNARGEVMIKSYGGDVWDSYDETLGPWEEYPDKQGYQLLTMHDVRARLFNVIDATPNLDWLLVTKRPENVIPMWINPPCKFCDRSPCERLDECSSYAAICSRPYHRQRPNVWLLTSVACQADADKNIPELLKCRDLAPVLGVSAEPLLEPIELEDYLPRFDFRPTYPSWQAAFGGDGKPTKLRDGIDWVIAGGESGNKARPCLMEAIEDLRLQCDESQVPFFAKQMGSFSVTANINQWDFDWPACNYEAWGDHACSARIHWKDAKGGDPDEWPEDLRVRQFPEVA